MFDVGSQATADQDRADYCLKHETVFPHSTVPRDVTGPDSHFLSLVLTLICHELSHLTSLKFLPRVLLVQKHTLRILVAPPSPVKCASGPGSTSLCLGLGTLQDKVSPDITSYMVTAGRDPSCRRHSADRSRGWRQFQTRGSLVIEVKYQTTD